METRTTVSEAEPEVFVSADEERAYERRDLRSVAWHFLYQVRHSPDFLKLAAPAASMMRVILALGEEPEDREAAIAETAVIGGILHGIAPRDEAGWAIAGRHFDEPTLEDLRHWTPLQGWFGHPAGAFCACGCRWRDNEAVGGRRASQPG